MGPGSLLGGRYVAHRRLSVDGRCERWSATDTVLEREVCLVCLPASLPQAAAVLDAARRASALTDPRLVAVLDVGADGGLRYVVEEVCDGVTLAALLSEGALPADEVRRIVGEAAVVLERARLLGLHHQVLTARSILRSPSGRVCVRGLAIEAALFELEEPDSALASRRDAEGLVALAYAGLTTRWPIRTPYGHPEPGLDPAPRIVGGVAAPSELAAGVPADLDLISRLTLRDGAGPSTPGDLANQIAPWSETPVDLVSSPRPMPRFGAAALTPKTVTLTGIPAVGGAAEPGRAGDVSETGSADEAAHEGPDDPAVRPAGGSTGDPSAEPEEQPAGAPAEDAATAAATPGERGEFASEPGDRGDRGDRSDDHAPTRASAGAGQAESVGSPDHEGLDEPGDIESHDDDLADDRPPITTREALATSWAAARHAAGAAGTAAAAASARTAARWRDRRDRRTGSPGSVWDNGTKQDGGPEQSGGAERAGGPPQRPKGGDAQGVTRRVVDRVSTTLSSPGSTHDSPAPFLPPAAHTPERDQSRAAILILAGLVVVALVVALYNLPPIFGGSSDPSPRPSPSTTTKAVTATTSPAGPAPTALAITAVTSYDPEGDGKEGDNRLARAWDKNPTTFWYSSTYVSASWSGLKSGVGLVLDLGAAHRVSAVTVTLHGRQSLQVLAGNEPSKSGASLLGAVSGDGPVTVKPATAVTARYVVLWITNPANVGSGQYRAEVSEVAVLGGP